MVSDGVAKSFLRAGIGLDKKHYNHNVAKLNRLCDQQLVCVGTVRQNSVGKWEF